MMGEIVTRNMYSKAIAENKNAVVASCWTYFTTKILNVCIQAWNILFTLKNPTASAGFEPANLGTKGQHATSRPPKLYFIY